MLFLFCDISTFIFCVYKILIINIHIGNKCERDPYNSTLMTIQYIFCHHPLIVSQDCTIEPLVCRLLVSFLLLARSCYYYASKRKETKSQHTRERPTVSIHTQHLGNVYTPQFLQHFTVCLFFPRVVNKDFLV